MKGQIDQTVDVLVRAEIFAKIMKVADVLYEEKGIAGKTASILIYLNLVEWLLCFLVRQIALGLSEEEFTLLSLGLKIKSLREVSFNHKDQLMVILEEINVHRIKIVHNMVETIANQQMEKSIEVVKKEFDKLNECIILITESYGIT